MMNSNKKVKTISIFILIVFCVFVFILIYTKLANSNDSVLSNDTAQIVYSPEDIRTSKSEIVFNGKTYQKASSEYGISSKRTDKPLAKTDYGIKVKNYIWGYQEDPELNYICFDIEQINFDYEYYLTGLYYCTDTILPNINENSVDSISIYNIENEDMDFLYKISNKQEIQKCLKNDTYLLSKMKADTSAFANFKGSILNYHLAEKY